MNQLIKIYNHRKSSLVQYQSFTMQKVNFLVLWTLFLNTYEGRETFFTFILLKSNECAFYIIYSQEKIKRDQFVFISFHWYGNKNGQGSHNCDEEGSEEKKGLRKKVLTKQALRKRWDWEKKTWEKEGSKKERPEKKKGLRKKGTDKAGPEKKKGVRKKGLTSRIWEKEGSKK